MRTIFPIIAHNVLHREPALTVVEWWSGAWCLVLACLRPVLLREGILWLRGGPVRGGHFGEAERARVCLVRLTSVCLFSGREEERGRESLSSERTVRDAGLHDSSLQSWKQHINMGQGWLGEAFVFLFVFSFSMRALHCIHSGVSRR